MSQMNLENLASLVTIRPTSPPVPSSREPNDHPESFDDQLEQARQVVGPSTEERSDSPPKKTEHHEPSEETAEQPTSPETETTQSQPTGDDTKREPSDEQPISHDEDVSENRVEPFLNLSQSQETSVELESEETIDPTTESIEEITSETRDENRPFDEPELIEPELDAQAEPKPTIESTSFLSEEVAIPIEPTESRVSEISFEPSVDVPQDTTDAHQAPEESIGPQASALAAEITTTEPEIEAPENPKASLLVPSPDDTILVDEESPQGIQPMVDLAEPSVLPSTTALKSSEPTDETRLSETNHVEGERLASFEMEIPASAIPLETTDPTYTSPDATADAAITAIPVDSVTSTESHAPTAESHTMETRPIEPTSVESSVAIEPPSSSEGTSARTTLDASTRELDRTMTIDRGRFVQRVTRAFQAADNRSGVVRIQLHPPELGSLRLELTVRNGMMHARLETETSVARNLLLDNLPALRQRLAEQEIKVEQFNVDVSDRQSGGSHHPSGNQSRSNNQADSRTFGQESPAVENVEPNESERTSQRNEPASFDVSV